MEIVISTFTGALRGLKEVCVKCLALCLTEHRSIQQKDGSQVAEEDEGDEEEEDIDVSDVGAKPGNSQASALPTHFQKRQTSPVSTHSPPLCLDGDAVCLARLLLLCQIGFQPQ